MMSSSVGRLQGKLAVVTGAGSGIGRAVAVRFADEGAAVLVADLVESNARKVASEIQLRGGRALAIGVDISNEEQVDAMMATARRELGLLNVLVTCAGVLDFGTVADTSAEKWNRVIGVNLTGTFLTARAAIPIMIEAGGGSIVTFSSSTGAHDAAAGIAAYITSKGGVAMLTKCIAIDHAAQGIRANAIAPGPVATPMVQSVMSQDELDRFGKAMPVGRLARPEEMAAAAVFLASDEASYVTGAVFAVDGGQTAKIGMSPDDLGTVSRQTS